MALAVGPAKRALAGSAGLGLGGCGAPRRGAYEWGVRSTRKPGPPPLDRVYEIPGLEPITYAGKMHFMPGLARPIFPPWDRGWKHPKFHRPPPFHEHPLYKDQPCYVFHQRCRLLEGVKQALWLTKTKLIEGLPEKVLSLVDDPRNHIENQDERVLNIISHARLWHSTEDIPKRMTYCPVIMDSLIQLCKSQILKYPSLAKRIFAQNYALSTSWNRAEVRGLLLRLFARLVNLSLLHMNLAGFREGYPYPHPHTLYFLDRANTRTYRFQPDQLRAKMILFAFGNALAQARLLYGNTPRVLEQPVVVQGVGTDGRVFQFLVLQLNTTDLDSDEGVKNLVWVDSDQLLYQHFWCRPVIKKKVVVEPVGPIGFQPETFRKFLALYLHGAL
ncbi:PREDICTED: 39S ribosomal protein L37, mitochondrial [Dipodomys ordii]|uniref:Large ribosomal subunit protein mL37 n=1 Tax=Dipodomys ordii TaxID=10020 RepID=A0A1S3FPA2_DIPOR|nr:PREDICTED: 39S ribosomal protein L37, mitochondrial [Dipodomys ordii]